MNFEENSHFFTFWQTFWMSSWSMFNEYVSLDTHVSTEYLAIDYSYRRQIVVSLVLTYNKRHQNNRIFDNPLDAILDCVIWVMTI